MFHSRNTRRSYMIAMLALSVALPLSVGGCFLFNGSRNGGSSRNATSSRTRAATPQRQSSPKNEAAFRSMSFPSLKICKTAPTETRRTVWFYANRSTKYRCRSRKWTHCRRQELTFVEMLRSGDKKRVTRIVLAAEWKISRKQYQKMSKKSRYHTSVYILGRELKDIHYDIFLRKIAVNFAGINVANADARQVGGKVRYTKGILKGGSSWLRFRVHHQGSKKYGTSVPLWLKTSAPDGCPTYNLTSADMRKTRSWGRILSADKAVFKTDGLEVEISKHLRTMMFKKLKSLGVRKDFSFTPRSNDKYNKHNQYSNLHVALSRGRRGVVIH